MRALPSRRSHFNGVVERGSDTCGVEFSSQYVGDLTVHAVAGHLDSDLPFYNTVRPRRRSNMRLLRNTLVSNLRECTQMLLGQSTNVPFVQF